jgi:cation diffusion facilitator CzcD-associated flavoprotein CzcO
MKNWTPIWLACKSCIELYADSFADSYTCRRRMAPKHVQFNKKVTKAQWSEENQKLTVPTESGGKIVANFLINGDVSNLPDFNGYSANSRSINHQMNSFLQIGNELFKGKSFQTARK